MNTAEGQAVGGERADALHAVDRALLAALQEGLPVCERPFAELAQRHGLSEAAIVARIEAWLANGLLTRFGPMYHADRMGGAYLLAALAVPEAQFDAVAAKVNAQPEVAHNYRRAHWLNMWFVIAAASTEAAEAACRRIETATGLAVWRFPKAREYGIGLRLPP